MVLHSICEKLGKDPQTFVFFLSIVIWNQFTSDCLWASFCLSKDHEELKRVATNRSFSRRQVLVQAVRRCVQTLIERKDA